MANTPILGLPQVTPNQNNKEVTINDAIMALESATNGNLTVTYGSEVSKTLSETAFTRSFLFTADVTSADAVLQVPVTVAGDPSRRLFAVRNKTGFGLTVRSADGAGASVVIPNNETRLLAIADNAVFVAAQPSTPVSFLALGETPKSYAGKKGQALVCTNTEDGLAFVALNGSINDFDDVDTTGAQDGKVLVFNGGKWVAGSLPAQVRTLLSLDDVPDTYGDAGTFLRVNGAGNGIEFATINQVPNTGSAGQVLTKGTQGYAWAAAPIALPKGGNTGQHLAKASNADGDAVWVNADTGGGGGGGSLPDGGTAGQVLTKASSTNGDALWADAPSGGGGETGPIFTGSKSWRVRVLQYPSGFWGFAEVLFADAEGNQLAVGGQASASSQFDANRSPDKAFDGNYLQDQQAGYLSDNKSANNTLGYTTPQPIAVAKVAFYPLQNLDQTRLKLQVEYLDSSQIWQPIGEVIDLTTANLVFGERVSYDLPALIIPAKTIPDLGGNAKKVLAVNVDEDGLEWVSAAAGGSGGGTTQHYAWGKAIVPVVRTFDAPNPIPSDFGYSGTAIGLDVIEFPDTVTGTKNVLTFRGGALAGNSNARINIPVSADDTNKSVKLRFFLNAEPGFDGLGIEVDGVRVGTIFGQNDASTEVWQDFVYDVPTGDHTLSLVYFSDGNGLRGFENVRFSKISYPASRTIASYQHGDTVAYQGRYYMCIAAGTAATPGLSRDWQPLGRQPVTLVQKATLKSDGPIALPAAPTPGNLMVIMVAGWGKSLAQYVPQDFMQGGVFENGGDNGVQCWYKTVKAGDTGSYNLSAADNQAAVLYEFANAWTVVPVVGGPVQVEAGQYAMKYPRSPFGPDVVLLGAVENDVSVTFTIPAQPGVTQDFVAGDMSHPSVFYRINQRLAASPAIGTIDGPSSSQVFGLFAVIPG